MQKSLLKHIDANSELHPTESFLKKETAAADAKKQKGKRVMQLARQMNAALATNKKKQIKLKKSDSDNSDCTESSDSDSDYSD